MNRLDRQTNLNTKHPQIGRDRLPEHRAAGPTDLRGQRESRLSAHPEETQAHRASTPTVSIGLLSYNDEAYIGKAIADILAQTIADLELIISDDGSQDGSDRLCRQFARADQRIRYYRQQTRLGMQNNYRFVLRQARAPFFMWASSDDRWAPTFIEVLLAALQCDDSLITAFCPFQFIGEDDTPASGALTAVRIEDYAGATPTRRIARFALHYSDGCFYGLHRRARLSDVTIPIWWWINAPIAYNNNYPVIVFLLSRGGYVQTGGDPLFFKRIHTAGKARHSNRFSDAPFLGFVAFYLRKINVLVASIAAVRQGSGTLSTVVLASPALALRCGWDCAAQAIGTVRRQIARL